MIDNTDYSPTNTNYHHPSIPVTTPSPTCTLSPRWMASTKFQPIGARRVFPCVDRPDRKADFTLSIIHSSELTAYSNQRAKVIGIYIYIVHGHHQVMVIKYCFLCVCFYVKLSLINIAHCTRSIVELPIHKI